MFGGRLMGGLVCALIGIMILVGCSSSSFEKYHTVPVAVTGSLEENEQVGSGSNTSSGFVYDDLSEVVVDDSLVGMVWTGADGFVVNDSTWQGVYGIQGVSSRGRLSDEYGLFAFMGIHAADVGIGYSSGSVVIDLFNVLVHFPVDADSFVIYDGQYRDSDRPLTDGISLVSFPSYSYCPERVMITATGGGVENPLRCFAEDRDYVYAWRVAPSVDGYELVRRYK